MWEASFLSIYMMSRLARQHGVKVLLTGDGGDELSAGYPWIAAAWRQERYERLPFVSTILPIVARLAPTDSLLQMHARNLQGILGQSALNRYELSQAVFDVSERRAFTGRQDVRLGCGPLATVAGPVLAGADGCSRADQVALLDLALWLRDHFNQRLDRMTMMTSVEARVPFQDNAVVDLALQLPFLTKAWACQPKKLLKDAFRKEILELCIRPS